MSDIEALAWGYGLVEGPRADDDPGTCTSPTCTAAACASCVRTVSIDVVVPKRRGVGGISLHADGGVVVSGRNICHVRDGETRILFAPDAPGLNDLIVDAAGSGGLRHDAVRSVRCGGRRPHRPASAG